jgi:hypothetical protein
LELRMRVKGERKRKRGYAANIIRVGITVVMV